MDIYIYLFRHIIGIFFMGNKWKQPPGPRPFSFNPRTQQLNETTARRGLILGDDSASWWPENTWKRYGLRMTNAGGIWDLTMNSPRCSMYGIFTYIYPKNSPNAGKYSIHGASGSCFFPILGCVQSQYRSKYKVWIQRCQSNLLVT